MLLIRSLILPTLLIILFSSILFFQLYKLSHQIRSNHSIKQTIINTRYSYYVCAQIMDENESYLIEWIEYQLHIVGFKNICLINVGQPFNQSFLSRYRIGIIHKEELTQEFNYCLNCFDSPMHADDLLFIQDVDEFLNVQQAKSIYLNYDKFDKFHFQEIRYGYIHMNDDEMINKSLLTTNVYRKPHVGLGEYTSRILRDLFNCKLQSGWYSCDDSSGKEMIKVGMIDQLGIHFHQLKRRDNRSQDTFHVDMKEIRLHHYLMRTRDNGIRAAQKWNKISSKMGVINANNYFKMIFDDSIKESKRLL